MLSHLNLNGDYGEKQAGVAKEFRNKVKYFKLELNKSAMKKNVLYYILIGLCSTK